MSFRAEHHGSVDLFDLHRLNPAAYPFLLQSVAGHPQSGRYDVLFAFPQRALTLVEGKDFFAELTRQYAAEKQDLETGLPFSGGWFLYLGYEAARSVEPKLQLPPSPHRWPDALAVRCPAAAIYDRELQVTHLFAENDTELLERLQADLRSSFKTRLQSVESEIISSFREDPAEDFLEGVERVLEYLCAGDTFQVNLSRGWRATD
jgi:anthranilate synthase component 1